MSVVVPIYNAGKGKRLDKCIKSILSQTFIDIEVMLVNDGSTDNSLEVCRKYQKEDGRIVIIDKKNGGCIAARRTGVEASTSEFVMFVDADDWLDKNTVDVLYNKCMESSADISVCNMYKVLGRGALIKRKNDNQYFYEDRLYNKDAIMRDLVTSYFYGHSFPSSLCGKLYKRELLINNGKYLDRICFLGEDLFYNLEILVHTNRVKVIDQALYYYRVGGSTSKYMSYLFDDMINGYRIQKEVIHEYYLDTKQKQYNGISIMLLNTFRTCLCNIINSKLSETKIKDTITEYVSNECVSECLVNEGSVAYFPQEYLNAIKDKDIDYLYEMGKKMYKKRRAKTMIMDIFSKLSVV
ncbi:glycosyltransferase family 2 protein [Paenibacillus radicis (ex Xue et al. 2023)]|uniref:Glycosyltransferase n=1 Tax=Paenibacillus radicis (ex Xue et al. 2023) TaxID=2972489 RepID=A0ABT1YQT2_9BACL|nr:glycosyltransferase [Paenibacillus radicis (ex Xue et al. 2023)]MCR8635397.1 glycosyltransferase [Paenibacillus radicis (ex Xue et al. 2023)]